MQIKYLQSLSNLSRELRQTRVEGHWLSKHFEVKQKFKRNYYLRSIRSGPNFSQEEKPSSLPQNQRG